MASKRESQTLPTLKEEQSDELRGSQSLRSLVGDASSLSSAVMMPAQSSNIVSMDDIPDVPSTIPASVSSASSRPQEKQQELGPDGSRSSTMSRSRSLGNARTSFQQAQPLAAAVARPDDDEDLEDPALRPAARVSFVQERLPPAGGTSHLRPSDNNSRNSYKNNKPRSFVGLPGPLGRRGASLPRSQSLGDHVDNTTSSSHSGAFMSNHSAHSGGSTSNTGSSGGFTKNLSRKSQNFRNSVARRSTALARFTRHSSMEEDVMEDAVTANQSIYRGYSVGDMVLISNHNSRWANTVNRFGFPPDEGTALEEQRGPYSYVLGKVKQVHYEENEVFYTVAREDTGVDVRGDAGFMEPILSKIGEEAARKAATKFALGSAMQEDDNVQDDHSHTEGNEKALKVLENIVEILLLPFFLVHDLFVFVIGARLFRWAEAMYISLRHHAHMFLNGLSPYQCSARITIVNVIVLCFIWYMFIDQARLAFFPTKADNTLAVLNFVIWTILCLELMFEVFVRPDGYHKLIRSDKAFAPMTVRFISGLHLVVEFVSLGFFVPEFLCLFTDTTCDGRPVFSFLHSTLLAVTGPTPNDALLGRVFYACLRLRVFGLVRHWKNMWINKTFLKRRQKFTVERKKHEGHSDEKTETTYTMYTDEGEVLQSVSTSTRNRILQKQRDAALINASNIGTALMVTNSYRALTLLCTILGVFPMITLIQYRGVTNSVAYDMIRLLQGTNKLVTAGNETNCDFLVDSVESWVNSFAARDQPLFTSTTDQFLIALVIQPSRCVEKFEALNVRNMTFSEVPCEDLEGQYDLALSSGKCIRAEIGAEGDDLQEMVQKMDLRVGNIQTESSEEVEQSFEGEDGTSFETTYAVAAHFNQTHATESSAFASLLLQFCLLVTVLGGLSVLRRDAEDLVLGPLRSMLKIVARYAKNPLAQAESSSKDNQSVLSDSESEPSSHGDDDDNSQEDGLGTYETEQLITAVAKITDLLRKCWGVAGADIISTNLASREGALAEVFNPTVPGKSVYALFAFAAINGFDHALKCLGGDVMILINDVAAVLHGEVYRWGFGDSGQCNKNLGAAFLMVFRIGLVKEVLEKLEEATQVVFSTSRREVKKLTATQKKVSPAHIMSTSADTFKASATRIAAARNTAHALKQKHQNNQHDAMADAMKMPLQSLPGISTFTDRAVIGMLKSFSGIHRDNKLRAWSRDFRLSAGVGAFSVNMIFGMDAGWAVEGAVGSEYKIDATYLSPHVNMASRMMSACKHYGVTILLSEAVQELMSDTARTKLRNLDRVTVKGSSRIQKLYTFDARHKGADFFLFSRSDEQADLEAERYIPSIWNRDQDLKAMRHHVTDDFEMEFNMGMKAYYDGDWPAAIKQLEHANEIMVDAAMEEGYLHDEMDDSPDRKELYRSETSDGPCSYLIGFMKSEGGVAPEGWAGWHPLLSK